MHDDGRDSWQALGSVVEKIVMAATPAGFRGIPTTPSPGHDGASSFGRLATSLVTTDRREHGSARVDGLPAACGAQAEGAGSVKVGGVRGLRGGETRSAAHTRPANDNRPGVTNLLPRGLKERGTGAGAARASWPGRSEGYRHRQGVHKPAASGG